jgi:hypothetical protein
MEMNLQDIIVYLILAGCLVWICFRIYHIISASRRNESMCNCCSCGCSRSKRGTVRHEECENNQDKDKKSCPK